MTAAIAIPQSLPSASPDANVESGRAGSRELPRPVDRGRLLQARLPGDLAYGHPGSARRNQPHSRGAGTCEKQSAFASPPLLIHAPATGVVTAAKTSALDTITPK